MKLRARFPQIGVARADASPGRAGGFTSRSGSTAQPELAVQPAALAPGPTPIRAHVPVMTSEFAPPVDWPSTVAAWRSTTGKPGDRP
jgi:hypothetical protein